ncbi:succinylglutamate desuccinylase/aspartoacylase family protein [Natrinema caseinilyticum]|uniref:succinylglutamate desuccinylase/aspartoacylase family protein n=1 Tax=Natrinema caseinilyticum TaxID=2961570 RepID=UPI0020C36A89|nr:succinylglutamate desuccinylase/aspartoacylase family protein [Natrinema caseinilyticum]
MNDPNGERSAEGRQRKLPSSRRSVLTGGAAAIASTVLGSVGTVSASAHESCPDSSDGGEPSTGDPSEPDPTDGAVLTLQSNTAYETEVFVNDAPRPGPTGVVVGGMDGNELSGVEAAYRALEWELDRGTLVVLPEADAVAVERRTYNSPRGNLNRQFPVGQPPTSSLAEELWTLITEVDPDVVIDFHSSKGIWGSDLGPDGYGQAIYPSVVGDSRRIAADTAEFMNREYIYGAYRSAYQFTVGNTLLGDKPKLMHKVAGDLERPGYLTEVTRYGTSLETRIEWNTAMAAELLRNHGIR